MDSDARLDRGRATAHRLFSPPAKTDHDLHNTEQKTKRKLASEIHESQARILLSSIGREQQMEQPTGPTTRQPAPVDSSLGQWIVFCLTLVGIRVSLRPDKRSAT